MPIQPIKIPQNVYIEDRIVGPLTLKQILIVGIGVGFSYALYGMLTKAYGALALPITITVWSPAAIAAVFAFVRINDISMFRLVLLAVERLNKPTTRVWTPRRGITVNIRTFNAPQGDQKNQAADIRTDANVTQLDELSVILDRKHKESSDLAPAEAAPNIEDAEEADESEEPLLASSSDSSESSDSSTPSSLPVNPSRVAVSSMSTATSSIFRDLSPQA